MSLIQDPVRALNQTRWYLANQHLELLPTAFSLAAGNLLRQVVEQMLFVLAFYSGLPTKRFIRSKNGQLEMAGRILTELRSAHLGKTYLHSARARHPYLRRIGRSPQTLKRWIKALNDPSHFGNPARRRRTRGSDLDTITTELEKLIDPTLFHLVIAAANQLRTRGRVRAVLGTDPQHTIGIERDVIVKLKHLTLRNGALTLSTPPSPIRIVSSEQAEPLRPSTYMLMVQHQTVPALQARLLTSDRKPVDLTNLQTILQSLGRTPARRRALIRRLRQLGFVVTV